MLKWLTRLTRPQRGLTPAFRPALEALEDRRLMAGNVLQTNLVSDLPGVARTLDRNLVNPWGISESAGSPFWVSDNNAGVSTLYNTAGTPQSLVVSIPAPGDPLGATGTPTGTVFNTDGGAAGGFKVSGVNKAGAATSAAAIFLFATEDGTIVGWNPGVNPSGFDPTKAGTYGILAVDNSANPSAADGAVYKGQAIATGTNGAPISTADPNSTALLYNTNFRAGTVDVFDPNFKPAALPKGAFTDPTLPKGYAPFNVEVLNGKVYVTYALQNADKHDSVAGHGRGFVDTYNLDGTGEQRLISRGALDSPWGLAIAPSSFGSLAGSLLVGNFGDGHINAYNATTGASMGAVKDPDGEPIQIDGLWALKVGNGGNGGDATKVYFTAGLDHEQHGLFGSLTSVAPGTAEGPAEAQTVQAELDVTQLAVNAFLKDISSGASGATLRQDFQTLETAVDDLVRAEIRFLIDTHTLYPGSTAQGGATLQTLDTLFAQLDRDLDHHDRD